MRYARIPILAAVLLISAAFVTADEPAQPGEPEVLTTGPIHEAYASAVNLAPVPGTIAPKEPPDPIEELPPDQKPEGDNVQWIPGYFAWEDDQERFIWVSGFWRQPPPNRQWVPGGWRQVADGWQWTGGFWADAGVSQVEYIQEAPPAPIEAAVPPSPGADYTFVPGVHVYHNYRYVWRPGYWWRYQPNWVYIPAHYVWTPCGYVFVDGYWDYPLRQRGVIFAPVYFGPGFYRRPAYVYRPSFVIYDEALYGALFVRTGYSSYYFGNYFESRYNRFGYRPWIDVRIGGGYDPLYGYYRRAYASNPQWSVGIGNLYAARFRGDAQRPPRTFAQQNVVINNITNNTTVVNSNAVKNVTMVAPLAKVDRTAVTTLKPVTQVEQTRAREVAKEVRQASIQRVKLESQAAAPKADRPKTKTAEPIKLNMPKTPVANVKPATPPPQAPSLPKDTSKDQPKAKDQVKDSPKVTPPPLPKDAPKTPAQPKEKPKDTPKETPKSPTPPTTKDAPKVPAPKETPKSPAPSPKDAPKTPVPIPKETPKSPPAPKSPMTPPPIPKDLPKTPPPAPKETPKAPAPKETPKSPPPSPPAPKATAPQPKAPTPQPMPSNPPPQPKLPPPQPKAPPPPAPPPPPPKAPAPPPKQKEPPKSQGKESKGGNKDQEQDR